MWIGVWGFVLLSLLLAGCALGPADTERVSAVVSSTLSPTPPPAGSSTTPSPDESAPTESATTSQLLDSAREQLASVKQSDYQHQTDVDTTAGRYDYDCSGLLDYTIGVVAPDALAQIPTTASAGRALAENFEGFLANNAARRGQPVLRTAGPGDRHDRSADRRRGRADGVLLERRRRAGDADACRVGRLVG